jgi:hypothetical protein
MSLRVTPYRRENGVVVLLVTSLCSWHGLGRRGA